MEKVQITAAENNLIMQKFYYYNSLLNVLSYLCNNVNSIEIFDKKFDEAVHLNIELEQLKTQCGEKYRPDKKYKSYTFDFDTCHIIYEE